LSDPLRAAMVARAIGKAPMRITKFEHEHGEYLVLSYPIKRPASFAKLNAAELAVIEAVLEGTSHKEIARARDVSVRTVANQLASAYRKLGVSSATDVAMLVREANEAS
jgi:DNA-binding NarL/FixJ family response regulator